jgi:hypothetical protein
MTYERTCKTCRKKFRSQKIDSTICYGCALKHFAGNRPPEEGDFNSASIVSGEMTDEEARSLQKELESVDHSGEEANERRLYEGYDDEDHRWDYLEERDDDE